MEATRLLIHPEVKTYQSMRQDFAKILLKANGIVTPRLASKTTTIFKGYIHSQIIQIKDKMRIQVEYCVLKQILNLTKVA